MTRNYLLVCDSDSDFDFDFGFGFGSGSGSVWLGWFHHVENGCHFLTVSFVMSCHCGKSHLFFWLMGLYETLVW